MALVTSLGAQSITCTARTKSTFDKEFCAQVNKGAAHYKPVQIAANRRWNQATVEFSSLSAYETTLTSVLVKDPIGKNTVKLIFAWKVRPSAAVEETIKALSRILQTPATALNVGWIVVVPETPNQK